MLVRTESKELRSESQILRNESKELRNEAQALRSDHHRVYTEELNKIELNSNNDKRIETFDKVTTYPYGTNAFKVCEGEMLSKNKLIEPDEVIDNTKTEDIGNTKTEDIDNTKIKDIDNTKTKDKDRNKRRNKRIQMFMCIKRWRNKNGNRKKKRRIVCAFWDDDHISELCEKWVYYDGNYAYTRFEELRKCSGEVLFTREYKATASKDNSNVYIDIDKLQMFKDFSIRDKTTAKTKDMLNKINNKISMINKTNEGLAKVKAEVAIKVELIYEAMVELQDEIYSDDSWLRLVELDKIDAIIEEAFNVVWKVLWENKNRINLEMIEIDKHKDIDGYVSELTNLINHKIGQVNRMCEELDHVMSEIKNETDKIDEKIHKVREMDDDTLHWIDDKLNNIMTRSRRKV